MDLIWNEFLISQPPLVTLPVKHITFSIPDLRNILEDFIAFYGSQSTFEESAALCARIIARRKNSFRKMDGFKSLCKLNAALCRLLRVDIKTVLNNFLGMLPEYAIRSEFNIELPPLSNLEYVLIRLIGLHKLFLRIFNCCKQVARYFSKLLSKNYFMDITTLILAITSTIWKISFNISSRTSTFYKKILKYRSHFPQSKTPWISNDFKFPNELEKLLEIPLDVHDQKTNLSEVENIIGSQDETMKNKSIRLLNNPSEKPKKLSLNVDVGVALSRESLAPQFDLNKFNNVEAIRQFLKDEEKKRQECVNNCITKAIPNEEWVILKKRIRNRINSNDSRATVKAFKASFEKILKRTK